MDNDNTITGAATPEQLRQPGSYDLTIYRGDTQHWRYVLWQDADKTIPVDLTGCTVASQIRDKPDSNKIVELDCAVTLPNTIDVMLDATKSSAAFTGTGSHDVQVTNSSGEVVTVVAGKVRITPDITRNGTAPR